MNVKLLPLVAFLLFQGAAHAYKPEIGEVPAPLHKLEYVDGTPFDLSALRGKPAVIYFGADWCFPCVERGRPATVAVNNKYGPMGLQVIFVSMDDNKFRSQKIEEAKRLGLRIAMVQTAICPSGKCPDGLRDLGDFGRIYVYPTAFILDSSGIVRAKLDRGMGVLGLEGPVKEVMESSGLLTR